MLNFIAQTLGILGSFGIILNYFNVSTNIYDSNNVKFFIINFISALLLLISLLFMPNIGSITIEIFYLIISIIGYVRLKKK